MTGLGSTTQDKQDANDEDQGVPAVRGVARLISAFSRRLSIDTKSLEGDSDWWSAWQVRSVCGEINEVEAYGEFWWEHTLDVS